jgi:hypothetical protein
MISRSVRVWLGVLALVTTASAAEAQDSGLGASEVLGRMMSFLGGKDAIDAVHSLAVEARCSGPGGPFRTWIRSLRSGRAYMRQVSGRGTTEIWSTPRKTWTVNGDSGSRELGPEMREFVRSHEFHLLLLELDSRFRDHEVNRLDSAGGEDCVRIVMKDEAANPASLCIREADGLPLFMELNPSSGADVIHVRFNDWVWIEGVRYFRSFTLTEGTDRTFTYTYKYVDISPNSVTEELFRVPEELRDEEEKSPGRT